MFVGMRSAAIHVAAEHPALENRRIEIGGEEHKIGRFGSGYTPLLTVERVAYDTAGYAVDFGRHCYRPDLYSLRVTLVEK